MADARAPDATPDDVLDFWFGDVEVSETGLQAAMKRWYGGGKSFDEEITRRFAGLLPQLTSGMARAWARKGARERLAAVIALDQFSRNIHRGKAEAFSADMLARELSAEAIAAGEDDQLQPLERMFLLMPFEHSERMQDQETSVAEFSKLAASAGEPYAKSLASALDYAKRHADVIARFGRFPHRNAALGRTSTPDEIDYLKQPGSGF